MLRPPLPGVGEVDGLADDADELDTDAPEGAARDEPSTGPDADVAPAATDRPDAPPLTH